MSGARTEPIAVLLWRGGFVTGFLGPYRKLNDLLAAAVGVVASTVMAVIIVAPFAAAVIRYWTGQGYDWLAELPPQLIPWVVFPLVGVMLRRGRHIAVDVLPHFLRGRGLYLLRAAVLAVSLAACALFAVFGVSAVQFFARLGQLSTTELEFPLWYLYVSYPVGFMLAANFCLEGLLQHLAGNVEAVAVEPELQGFVQ
jgi:TRAP-type C4-dicarboxylate transport system permease small subunit